jgi:hypothetical protein
LAFLQGTAFLLHKPDVFPVIQPYYVLIVGVIVAWLGSQQQFCSLKERGLMVGPLKRRT